jgi:membrane dipeptidase
VRHIGLGSDFDGTDEFPTGLEGVDAYPELLAELARRGWSAADLAAVAGGNILRVLRETDDAFAGGRAATGLLV